MLDAASKARSVKRESVVWVHMSEAERGDFGSAVNLMLHLRKTDWIPDSHLRRMNTFEESLGQLSAVVDSLLTYEPHRSPGLE